MSYKLQSLVSRTFLQIDMQNLVRTKSDYIQVAIKREEKKSISTKFDILVKR